MKYILVFILLFSINAHASVCINIGEEHSVELIKINDLDYGIKVLNISIGNRIDNKDEFEKYYPNFKVGNIYKIKDVGFENPLGKYKSYVSDCSHDDESYFWHGNHVKKFLLPNKQRYLQLKTFKGIVKKDQQ